MPPPALLHVGRHTLSPLFTLPSHSVSTQPEYQELYGRFAGIYASEEAQRSQLWDGYLRDLREAVGEG